MKKLILLILILIFALPVMADTIIFTNGKKFTGCNMVNNGRGANCSFSHNWYIDDCKDKGLCPISIEPDSNWVKSRLSFGRLMSGIAGGASLYQPNYAASNYTNTYISPIGGGSYNIQSTGANGYHNYSAINTGNGSYWISGH